MLQCRPTGHPGLKKARPADLDELLEKYNQAMQREADPSSLSGGDALSSPKKKPIVDKPEVSRQEASSGGDKRARGLQKRQRQQDGGHVGFAK